MTEVKPLVSVCMITYNQENYISPAIEGVLMQITSFPVEFLIGEDCSTDNTRNICLEYKTKYPNRIKLRLPETNLGAMRNFSETLGASEGKYIAICEGDDYWTDPYKLQKQVDFLEANPEYGLVHTDNDCLYQKTGKTVKSINRNCGFENCVNPFYEILTGDYHITTCTVLFNKNLLFDRFHLDATINNKNLQGDLPLWLSISTQSKFKFMNESTAVYRKYSGSFSHSNKELKQLEFQESSKRIRMEFARKYNVPQDVMNIVEDMYYSTLLSKNYILKNKEMVNEFYKRIHKRKMNLLFKYWGSNNKIFRYIVECLRFFNQKLIILKLIINKKYIY